MAETSRLRIYFDIPNPRLKPGAVKFDAFSILCESSKQGLNRKVCDGIMMAETSRLRIYFDIPNPRLKPGAVKFDAFSILCESSKQGLNRNGT